MPERRYPKEVVLKGGEEVILRLMAPDDFQVLRQFYLELQPSLRWYMKEEPCEKDVFEKWAHKQKEGQAFSIVAVYGKRIVAFACLLMRPGGGRDHVGRLRIYVGKEFRRKQLGTWMVFDLIRYAMNKGLEMIRTDFVVGVEDIAIGAMRKLDFVTKAVIKDYVKDEEGHYHDYQIMIKQLHKEWSDF